jgi:hypothetical protein
VLTFSAPELGLSLFIGVSLVFSIANGILTLTSELI